MTPIPPKAVLFLLQSGWPADVLFPFAVDAINGLRSEISIGSGQRSGDSGYYRLIDLFRKIQASGAVGMRIKKGDEGGDATLLILHGKNITPEVAAAQQEIRQLLGLKPGQREFTITYGQVPADDSQIAILTRSMLQMMIKLAGEIDVPPEHIDAGMTVPSRFQPGSDEDHWGGCHDQQ
jgi:hypothetical protein